ncbi:HD domain-containing phosphohydrolase [Sulfurimonas sp. ST-27]|uniref:HD domain-containing phosphohydrolase n=1 Tax=Sulfurimonas sp. ST-27 TaxID=3400152 RepID=UPI003AB2FFB1
MQGIKFLGAGGSVSNDSYTTCIQLGNHTLIDAGNIMHSLNEKAKEIHTVFLSHSHLDHIVDIAFLLDSFFETRKETLTLYGHPTSLQIVHKNIFNNDIWPDFTKINIPGTNKPSLAFVAIEENKKYTIENNISLTPFASVHSIPCYGYIIEQGEDALFYSADTFKNEKLWKYINKHPNIHALIIDVSFPNALSKVAQESKHLTSQFLHDDMQYLQRKDIKIYINHIKPMYKDLIEKELHAIGIGKKDIIHDGDIITYKKGIKRRSLDSAEHKIEKLNKIGIALSYEQNINKLLENIVKYTREITEADGGTLYLLKNDKLHFTVAQTDSLGIKMGGESAAITWPPLPMHLEDGSPNKKMVAVMCALEGKVINIQDVYEAEGFSFEGTKAFDKSTGYRSKSMLVIPLRDHENKIIGVLQLINKLDLFNDTVVSFNKHDEQITLSLASQAAVAITKVKLIAGLENLLEAFLKSIIYAVGKKSPYTAGHIKRMVQLSLMLANAVNKENQIFQNKTYTKEQLQEINFAALMHDIGKLATPEQIVDKATKLETIYDRVYMIEARIALIKKEYEIACLKKEIDKKTFEDTVKELENYFDKIQESNKAAGFTSDEDVALFTMLADKVYQINNKAYKVLTKDEAYNLSIRKGTLTKEERQIINDHAKISLEILKKLPFPQKYKNIPEIAGSHHEKLNGKGYPRGLKGDEISFEARILAIADIFEALTASDRPYKKANPLSLAMKILYFMAKENELDKSLVKYFYTSGLYKEYAKKFLPKSSIDEVELDFNDL